MKKNDLKTIRNKPNIELQKLLKDEHENLRVLRFDLASGKVKNISSIRESRKNIARLMTFLKETKIKSK